MMNEMSRVIEISKTGDSSVLQVVELPIPSPSANDILVKNSFAGVNFIDTYHRSGVYPLRSKIIGMEGAGEVVAIGSAVNLIKVGDRVAWPATTNSYAEYVVVPHDRAVTVPDGVGLDIACAAMLQGMTAHYLITDVYSIKAGDVALVHAAAGGVGQILTQMIKNRGGKVIATCGSEEKAVLVRDLGADHVIVGYDNIPAKVKECNNGVGVNVVYDGVGKDTFVASLDSLRPRGMMVLYGGASGQVPPFDLQGLNTRGSLFVTRPKLGDYIVTAGELQKRAHDIFEEIMQNKLTLSIGKIYPVEDVRQSHDDLEGRKTTGKLLLKF
jgi:NADPH2:quinone reductase